MGPSVHVRIAGVFVRCHLATPVTLLVLLYGFTRARESAPLARVVTASIAVVLVLLVLALHELAKALVYARAGIRTRRIDLLIAGGATRLDEQANRPRTDVLAAVAGLTIAMLCAGTAAIARALHPRMDIVDQLATAVAPLLFAIALVQTLPAVPFDGGKFLRALVWAIGQDRVRGTKAGVLYGQLLSAGFIAGGGILLAAGGIWSYWGFGGLVLGGQILSASLDAFRDELVLVTSHDSTLAQLNLSAPMEMSADISMTDAAARLLTIPKPGRMLVVDTAHKPAGIIAARDLRRIPRRSWANHAIADLATPLTNLQTAAINDSALDALLRLERAPGAVMLIRAESGGLLHLVDERDLRAALIVRARPGTDGEVPVTSATRR